jgi:hypothetical protein
MSDFKIFSNKNDATVWAIDDGWFTGEQSLDAKLNLAISISGKLGELNDAIAGKTTFDRNFTYLKTLLEFCLQHELSLGLGSFEYFSREFTQIDGYQSAVLLDVRYPVKGEDQKLAATYGVYLLHKLLNGKRPKSETYPDNVLELLEERRDTPSWWPLLNSRVMSKLDPNLKNLLNPFFENFASRGNVEDRFCELARCLIHERRAGDDHTHPQDAEELRTNHQHIPLLASFLNVEDIEKGTGVESYSALYHTSIATHLTKKPGVYPISTQVFDEHCRYLGVRVDVKENRRFRLPIQPGLVFILFFCRFVLSLKAPQPTPTLSFIREGNEERAILSINLKDNRAFRASVLGSEEQGRATRWFKRMLRGEGKFVFKLADYDYASVPWLESIPIKEEKIYPLLVEPAITSEGNELKWKC